METNIDELEQDILNLKDPNLSLSFCLDNPKTKRFEEHQDIIINNGSFDQIYTFTTSLQYYDYCTINDKICVEKLEEKLLLIANKNNAKDLYLFAFIMKKSNKEKIFKKLLELNDLKFINIFFKDIKFDKDKFKDLLLFL